ncbi:MAG: hypothetical protein DCE90_18090 [Pseudanabaena sp.]|nr:MAG: hypothetical protein DCE90_18090 [Pseudanabaena sp.]
MNFAQVTDSQLVSVWFACLAWLNSPLPTEEKISILEGSLMQKILNSDQAITIIQGNLPEFDAALLDYAKAVEKRVRALNPSNISTGSVVIDAAFKGRIEKLIELNFGSKNTEEI